MEKQVLTHENIERDIQAFKKSQPKPKMRSSKHLVGLLAISGLIIIAAFNFHPIAGVVCLILPIIVAIIFVPRVISEVTGKPKVSKDEYTVIKDTLSNVGKETVADEYRPAKMGSRVKYNITEAEFLYFSTRKWRIPGRCYEWSTLYNMSGNSISNTSVVGDEFYLVILNETQEICVAYNAKLFEYK